MDVFLELLGRYGLLIVFLAVLLEQGGLPLPAYPIVVAATALAFEAAEPVWPILLVTASAAVIADIAWFCGGRYLGARMIRLMCSLSLSRDSCVSSTRDVYARWGLPSLVVAKFIPGLAAVATTMAGQMRVPLGRFLIYDGTGALLWSGGAVALGVAFHHAVADVLAQLEAWGGYGLAAILVLVAIFVGRKAWQRRQFRRQIEIARITVPQLNALLQGDDQPIIIDVRSAAEREASGWIPAAVLEERLAEIEPAPGRNIVVYCDCPNEASAALLARRLETRGLGPARPLAGGFEAWQQAGLPVQRPTPHHLAEESEDAEMAGLQGGRAPRLPALPRQST
jgi:membrane protein DedA with SNARE-associated domain/rhodanese-related sulfurtransferase